MTKINLKQIIQTTNTFADPGKNVQSFKKTGIKLYEELQSQDTHRSENKKVYKVEKKSQKLMKWLYQKHMHIFRLWRKHIQSFKMIGVKFYEELRSRGTHCLYI